MISAIVLNWNGRRFLEGCFTSLLKQTFKDYELILVDNGSSDGSLEFVKNNFPQVKIISLAYNMGFCQAMNIGIKSAKGKFIALLNNDTVLDRNWFGTMNNALDNNPYVGICASRILFYKEPHKINSAGDLFTISGEALNRGFNEENDGRYGATEEVFSATAAACIYRRAMLEKIGLFDEDFFNTYEDVDLSFRAHLKGWHCLYVPEALCYHYWLGTIGHYSPMNIFYMSKNNLNLLVKNMPFQLIKKYVFLILKRHLKISIGMALNGCELAFIKGRLAYLLKLPGMLKKRNVILKNRKITTEGLEELLTRI